MGVCKGKKKRKIQLVREENNNKEKRHVHQTSGARFIRTNNIVKNGEMIGSKGRSRIVEGNTKEGT